MGPSSFVAPLYDPVMAVADWVFLERYRVALAVDLEGTILDIGAGTGAMIPHYAAQDGIVGVIALEPDPAMRRRGREKTDDLDVAVHWIDGIGEALPLHDDSVDAVVCSLVLCSVEEPRDVIDEAARVMRTDGELRVLEHVAAAGIQGRFQEWVEPVWRRLADGCRPDRSTDRLLEESTAVSTIQTSRIRQGIPPIRPFHFGRYRPV